MHRLQKMLLRGLRLRCPACGKGSVVRGILRIHDRCPVCSLPLEHDDGFFLGALVLNYVVSFLLGVLPPIVLVANGLISVAFALVLAAIGSILWPVVFYWHAKSLWLAIYYFMVPEDLQPGRWQELAERELPDRPLTEQEREALRMEEAIAALEGGRPVVPPGRLQRK